MKSSILTNATQYILPAIHKMYVPDEGYPLIPEQSFPPVPGHAYPLVA
jgi:hypothetical protein